MRNNQPVTQQESFLPPKRPIITKTNLKGQITYANKAFIEISGFSAAELIGQPHNIVRHPDMPPEAFDDMWHTIKAGYPWQGVVKNRSKNSGFYWVDAYVSPLKENGETVGYMSVRNTPNPQQKKQAEQLYAEIRQKRAVFPATVKKQVWGLNRWLIAGLLPPILALSVQFILPDSIIHDLLNIGSIIWLILSATWLRRTIVAPLQQARAGLEKLTEANFSQPFAKSGCLELQLMQESLETMRINTRALISDVVVGANEVGQSAASAHEQAGNLQQRSQQAQQGLTRVAAALEQLAVSVNEISLTTNQGAQHAHDATRLAQQGEEDMQQTVNASRSATQEFNTTRDSLVLLKKSDQSAGPECSDRSRARRGTGARICRGSRRGAQAGRTDHRQYPGNRTVHQTADRANQPRDGQYRRCAQAGRAD